MLLKQVGRFLPRTWSCDAGSQKDFQNTSSALLEEKKDGSLLPAKLDMTQVWAAAERPVIQKMGGETPLKFLSARSGVPGEGELVHGGPAAAGETVWSSLCSGVLSSSETCLEQDGTLGVGTSLRHSHCSEVLYRNGEEKAGGSREGQGAEDAPMELREGCKMRGGGGRWRSRGVLCVQ